MTHKPTTHEPAGGSHPAKDTAPDTRKVQDSMQENAQSRTAEAQPEAAAETPVEPAVDPIAALESEKAELKDRLLRTLAEMENLRRRTEREVADARTYAVSAFARDILTVADNMHRALSSLPEEARAADGVLKALVEGVELTERDLIKTLERHGVKKLDPQGQRFDPHLHQAMFEVPDASVPNGTVVQVVQSGFVIGERVLRPALVGVSKGGPRTPNGNGNGNGDTAAASQGPAA
ncbi:nucleotide exchange factor GrpE [Chelatococcus sp. SYSU_G07232]|uniref:Protein GrpE n=1 Tax=Chelatococcus albus TaxID=3047466 RepID=A0ABT7AJD8_9HYPH|nr:nucleotide exchange factor GrpE [Chelatococcus sp. SYSU_G07232]MDJ1159495.1 nucleotide exchange factor GrpE [Chelatococcus sp. SYSU_G07232]